MAVEVKPSVLNSPLLLILKFMGVSIAKKQAKEAVCSLTLFLPNVAASVACLSGLRKTTMKVRQAATATATPISHVSLPVGIGLRNLDAKSKRTLPHCDLC